MHEENIKRASKTFLEYPLPRQIVIKAFLEWN